MKNCNIVFQHCLRFPEHKAHLYPLAPAQVDLRPELGTMCVILMPKLSREGNIVVIPDVTRDCCPPIGWSRG